MAYIPDDAKWYIAEIIEEFRFEDGSESLIHINFVLISADSPEEAYSNALALGKDGDISYKNTDGIKVTVVFRGLRDMNVVHDELEHGAELLYERKEGLSEEAIQKLIRPKEQLNIFRPI